MEVHHPHHPTHKKKWTEYLLEFLMLFLAVFLGFIAENLREISVEKHRAKEYMHSLIEDLEADTSNIQSTISLAEVIKNQTENLVELINNGLDKSEIAQLYRLNLITGKVVQVSFEDRTSSQLKNSGSLRMVKNSTIADSIRSYWENTKIIEGIADRYSEFSAKASDVGVQIFNNKYYGQPDPANRFMIIVDSSATLANSDPTLLIQFSNRKRILGNILFIYESNMSETKLQAANLISLINNEYHFK
ncbi:MAG TPA: hypothetical protein VFF27_01750 [Bacteroidia bacterium]|nr:hypothetical protein [Bacteroidia bacterium]